MNEQSHVAVSGFVGRPEGSRSEPVRNYKDNWSF